jgi:hypothetical protein
MSVVQQVLPISEFHQILKRRIRTNVPELCYEPCRNALRVKSRTKLAARYPRLAPSLSPWPIKTHGERLGASLHVP